MSSCLTHRACSCLFVVLAALVFVGCSDDNPTGPSNPQAPSLPAASTMTIDLSFFDELTLDAQADTRGKPDPMVLAQVAGKENFINAAVRVAYVHGVFCEALKAPVTAFALAIHSVPQRQSDGSWLWTYVYVESEIEYVIYLFGADAGDRTEWRMEVSTNRPEMPLDHFVWFDGEVLKYESRGYWQFYEPVPGETVLGPPIQAVSAAARTEGARLARIDWFSLTGNVYQLSVLNNSPTSPDVGDVLLFHASPVESDLTFTDASDPEAVYHITWYPDGSGSIQVPDYPADNPGQKACWDTEQFNVACPE